MALFMEEEARRGIALLNERRPGWEGRTNLDRLNMEWGNTCVLGQEFGSWHQARVDLRLSFDDAAKYGFNFTDAFLDTTSVWETSIAYEQLNATWRTLITELRSAHPQPVEVRELTVPTRGTPEAVLV